MTYGIYWAGLGNQDDVIKLRRPFLQKDTRRRPRLTLHGMSGDFEILAEEDFNSLIASEGSWDLRLEFPAHLCALLRQDNR